MLGVPHALSFIGIVEILVNPTDRLVLTPQRRDVGCVDQIQQGQQRRFAREQPSVGVVAVEQGGQVCAVEIAEAEQEHAVGIARFAQGRPGDPLIKLEGLGLIALGHALHDQPASLHHPQRRKPVQRGEGLFTHHAVQDGFPHLL